VWRACTHTQTLAWPWVDCTSEKPWPRSLIKPRRATITHMGSLWPWMAEGKRRLSHGNTSPFHFSPPASTKMLHWKRQARKRIPQPIVGDHQGDDRRFALCAVPPPHQACLLEEQKKDRTKRRSPPRVNSVIRIGSQKWNKGPKRITRRKAKDHRPKLKALYKYTLR